MSNIEIKNIDKNFPKAGQNNDTQGFRNNFSVISDNLEFAKNEIEDLQNNVLRSDGDNDLNGNTVEDALLKNVSTFYYDIGNKNSDFDVDYSKSQFQSFTATNDIVVRITNWPSGEKYSVISLAVKSDGVPREIIIREFEAQTLKFDDLYPENIIVNSADDWIILEIFSFDEGKTLNVTYRGVYSSDLNTTKNFRNIKINGDLTVQGQTFFQDFDIDTSLNNLEDVAITNLKDKQILRYNNDTGFWENIEKADIIEYNVIVDTSASVAGQNRFYINGLEITDKPNLVLDKDKKHRFDLSNTSNSQAPLRFSTTPDTNTPSSITPYLDNVEIVGTAGEAGSYIEIFVTEDTPEELFFYGERISLDTSLIGGGSEGVVYTGIQRKVGSFNKVIGAVVGNVEGTVSTISNHTSDDLPEGTNNLFFTAEKVRDLISAGGDLSYNSVTGEISFTERSVSEIRSLFTAAGNLVYDPAEGKISYTERSDSDIRNLFSASGDLSYNSSTGEFSISIQDPEATAVRSAFSASGDLVYDAVNGVFSYNERSDVEIRLLFAADGDLEYDFSTGTFSVTKYNSTDFANDLSTKTTDDLAQGTSNLYYSNARLDSYLTGGTGVDYSNGVISIGQPVATTDDVIFNNVTSDLTGNVQGNITSLGLSTFSNIDVNGGEIDGTIIGQNNPREIWTTLLEADVAIIFDGAIDGTDIGLTVPGPVNATDLTATTISSADVTLTGGSIDDTDIGQSGAASVTGTTVNATESLGLPTLTTAQRNNINTRGSMILNTDTDTVQVLTDPAGPTWVDLNV
jgi:hypothetical protein